MGGGVVGTVVFAFVEFAQVFVAGDEKTDECAFVVHLAVGFFQGLRGVAFASLFGGSAKSADVADGDEVLGKVELEG